MHLGCNATKLCKFVPEMMLICCAHFPSCKSLSHASLSKRDIFMGGGSLWWVFLHGWFAPRSSYNNAVSLGTGSYG